MAVRVKLSKDQEALLKELRAELVGINAALWAPKLAHCITLLTEDRLLAAATCFTLLATELEAYPPVRELVIRFYNSLFGGGSNMACATTHKTSTTVQGPGVCCAALSTSGLTPAVGVRVAAVNSKGACIVCEIKASTSKKHPGALVFKRGLNHVIGSQVSCASASGGCCALVGA